MKSETKIICLSLAVLIVNVFFWGFVISAVVNFPWKEAAKSAGETYGEFKKGAEQK